MFMKNLSVNGFAGKSEGQVDLTDQILGAILFPTEGAKMATLLVKDGVKIVAQIWLAPGGGLPKHFRTSAISAHDIAHVIVRGEVYHYGRLAPAPDDFHPSTLKWALTHSQQIAVWAAPFPAFSEVIGKWICDEALLGSSFQTIIETVPARTAEWREYIARYKRSRTEVRLFESESGDARYACALAALD
jgi:hypothetical protein